MLCNALQTAEEGAGATGQLQLVRLSALKLERPGGGGSGNTTRRYVVYVARVCRLASFDSVVLGALVSTHDALYMCVVMLSAAAAAAAAMMVIMTMK